MLFRSVDVSSTNNNINYEIEKCLGIEIIGDTKVRVQIMDNNYEDFDIIDDISNEEIDDKVDHEVNENYLM